MKVAHIKLSFKVRDDFHIGDCKNCPLNVEGNEFCKLDDSSTFCPINVEVIPDE